MLWKRTPKSRILDVARETFGAAWAAARSKLRKPDLAEAMEEAFAAGPPPVGLGATAHAAALAWTMPGFAAFDVGGAPEAPAAEAAPETADPAPDAGERRAAEPRDECPADGARANEPRGAAADPGPVNGVEAFRVSLDAGGDLVAAPEPDGAEALPAFLRGV